jgi:hypothetical protein
MIHSQQNIKFIIVLNQILRQLRGREKIVPVSQKNGPNVLISPNRKQSTSNENSLCLKECHAE